MDAPVSSRTAPRVLLLVLCLCGALVPGFESLALWQRTVSWAAAGTLHLGSAVTLVLVVVAAGTTLSRRWQWAAVAAACTDVAWQWVAGSEYALESVVQPAHVAAVTLIALVIPRVLSRPAWAEQSIVAATPLLLLWGTAQAWSPLVAVAAESYMGGERLIGIGMTTHVGLVASLVWVWSECQRQSLHRFAWPAALGLFGLQQAVLAGDARFLPLVAGCALACLALDAWLPRQRLVQAMGLAVLWGCGYMLTLQQTTMLAWNTTLWFGAVVMGTIVAVALAAYTSRPTEVTV